MNELDWKNLLAQWSKELIKFNKFVEVIPDAVIASGWLGFLGASEYQIARTEARLGVALPPSYRTFLKVTNGWYQINNFVYRMWSTEELDWFSARHQSWIDVWMEDPVPISDEDYFTYGEKQGDIRVEYLQTCLEISDRGDAAVFLLNPKIVSLDGEWEAWFFANWLGGARRYPSFWEMMKSEYEVFTYTNR